MSAQNQNNINDALRRFNRLAGLDENQLSRLAAHAQLREAASGSCLLKLGDREPYQLFLLRGELELIAADGVAHRVRDSDQAATGPVSRLRPSRYRVGAHSDVSYLLLDQQVLDDLTEAKTSGAMVVEETLAVAAPNELLDDSATHPLIFDVFHDLNGGRIAVQSDPAVAVRIGRALAASGNNISHMANALAACPALTLKILRAAKGENKQAAPRSIRTAVMRLGTERTFKLAANCVLRETLRCESAIVRQRLHAWWKRSRRIAAISTVLARRSERFDPDFAHIIGLLQGIAEPVLLGYAEHHADLSDPTALDNVIHGNRAELGRILLTMWDLPRATVEAAALGGHWDYDHAGEADYTDIVLVAQWHATIGSRHDRRPPPHEEIPAFAQLGMQAASPELSLTIVEEAENAIDRSDKLLQA